MPPSVQKRSLIWGMDRTPKYRTMGAALLLSLPLPAVALTIDEASTAYQVAMDHLAAARQALVEAQRQVVAAEHAAPLPGFDYRQLTAEMDGIARRLEIYLSPRDRADQVFRMEPDGAYFQPYTRP